MATREEIYIEAQGERADQVRDAWNELLKHRWGRLLADYLIHDVGGLEAVSLDTEPLGAEIPAIKDGHAADRHMWAHEGRRQMAVRIKDEILTANFEQYHDMRIERSEWERDVYARISQQSDD